MILYTLVFVAFLNGCHGGGGGGGGCFSTASTSGDFNIDEFEYQGDSIIFACIIADSQPEFHMTEVNGSIPSALVDRLDNGRDLSLFFHDVKNVVDSSCVLLRSFANEWSRRSNNNICIISYAYTTSTSKVLKMYPIVNQMVKTGRLEYVAKMTRDLVFNVRGKCLETPERRCLKNLSQVDISGFSFGAHIAGKTCQYLFTRTGERVRMLLALDPIKTPLFGAKIKDSIMKGIADYVQVVHTSKNVGIWDQIGDVDIYVKYEKQKNLTSLNDEHGLAFFIHVGISTKRLNMWASQSENGKGDMWRYVGRTLSDNECRIGVYAALNPIHRGNKFGLSLKRRGKEFWEGLGKYADDEILLGTQDVEKEENISNDPDSNICILCCENQKDTILYPCKHKHTCIACWKKWKAERRLNATCPFCTRKVTEVEVIN
ncbi:uncharacterized protein LOC116343978 [Contarinia nasturtii]|uniref:uncharacterized protein LOC116343978 n=1 Tax=Contarinia nasturtii TaxID=265458 RepID=UPI0012D49191|nr:uncharacterized protein LOC116343978 [Contarinia nasturtii]